MIFEEREREKEMYRCAYDWIILDDHFFSHTKNSTLWHENKNKINREKYYNIFVRYLFVFSFFRNKLDDVVFMVYI